MGDRPGAYKVQDEGASVRLGVWVLLGFWGYEPRSQRVQA